MADEESGVRSGTQAGAPAQQPAGGAAQAKPAPKPAAEVQPKDKPAAALAGGQASAAQKPDNGPPMSLDAVRNIPVTLTVVLGSVSMPVSDLMNLQRGKTIELKKRVGEPVDVLANGKLIARGEIVVLEEEEPVFAVSLTELVTPGSAVPSAKAQ